MHRLIFLDPDLIQRMGEIPNQPADPAIVNAVNDSIGKLDTGLGDVIRARYYEGLSPAAIAERNGIETAEVIRTLYEAKRQLKILLADFVQQRWGVKPDGICRICGHSRRVEIEKILLKYDCSRSWGKISREVEKVSGERFQPPQILKAHLKHINNQRRKENG